MIEFIIILMTGIVLVTINCLFIDLKKFLTASEERIISKVVDELQKKQERLPKSNKTEIHYYPTIYSGENQVRKRDLEITKKNAEKDFRGYSEWTEIEDTALRKEWKSGLNTSEIAKIHKRSLGAIIARLFKLGIYYGTPEPTNQNKNS